MAARERPLAAPRGTYVPRAQVMDAEDVRRAVWRMAHEIIEGEKGLDGVVLVGLQTGGVPLAAKLAAALQQIEGVDVPVGSIDVAFYRDDIGLRPVIPEAPTDIPWSLSGRTVVLVDDVAGIDLDARGAELRAPTVQRAEGANVNWVSRHGDAWRMRTFERGVEGETLACGTGAVAAATLIARWTGVQGAIVLVTSSGRSVEVTPASEPSGAALLAGEGRLVYRGHLDTI